MRRPSVRRPGFTLIELLLVISIIAILSMATFALFRAASTARSKARSKGDIQAIAMACENYKKTYGDYPCGSNGAGTAPDLFRKDMFDQLIGRRIIKSFPLATGTAIELIAYNDTRLPSGSLGRKQKAFIGYGEIRTNDDANFASATLTLTVEFRDAWDNPYDYRYRVLNSAGSPIQNANGIYIAPIADWKSPNFLVVSCGSNYVDKGDGVMPDAKEYWDTTAIGGSTMTKNGLIPTATYFEDAATAIGPFRADNLVNWSN
jgi:prepilin-type N-terminal cleavage/methylation domain-containing protein